MHIYIYIYIYHAKSRLNTPVWGSLRSPNNVNVLLYLSPNIILMLLLDVVSTQARLWAETTTDDTTTECEARRGGLTPTKPNPKLFHDIQTALSRLVSKASQLIENVTTNIAESWMHIRSKYDGEKVINRSQSGSWEHRCMGAGLQQNIGKQWGPEMWRQMTTSFPNKVFTDMARHSAKEMESNRKRKAEEEVKAKRRSSKYSSTDDMVAARKAYSRYDGGVLPDEADDDLSHAHLEQMKAGYYETKVVVTPETVNFIERQTLDQADNDLWIIERRKRITASNVGSISKMRHTTKKSKKVELLLYSNFRGNAATHYGSDKEESTRQQYETYMNIQLLRLRSVVFLSHWKILGWQLLLMDWCMTLTQLNRWALLRSKTHTQYASCH